MKDSIGEAIYRYIKAREDYNAKAECIDCDRDYFLHRERVEIDESERAILQAITDALKPEAA